VRSTASPTWTSPQRPDTLDDRMSAIGHDNERRQPRPCRKFSDEFKRDAVDLVLTTGRAVAEVAAELGIYDSTLGSWVRRHQDEQASGSGLSLDERARLKEREAENAKLRVERDLLDRTVAFWVKESPQ
jgi:transposase